MTDEPFPWEQVMAFGMGTLGWPPEQFWRATPKELAAALRSRIGHQEQPPNRQTLSALMKAHPDMRDQ